MGINSGGATNRRGSHLPNSRDSAMFRRLSKAVAADDEDDGIITIGLSSRGIERISH